MEQPYDFATVTVMILAVLVGVGFFVLLAAGVHHDYVRWKNKSKRGVHFAFPFPERPDTVEDGVLSDKDEEAARKSKDDHSRKAV